jgi:hypothetical protein
MEDSLTCMAQLKAVSLSKNVVRSIEAQGDLPPFEQYPRAHRVTYKYYLGVLSFLQEDYTKVRQPLQGPAMIGLTSAGGDQLARSLGGLLVTFAAEQIVSLNLV